MVPKHRFCSSTILRTALGLSTIIYNGGYSSLDKLFTSVFSSIGYFSAECFGRLHTARKLLTSKVKKRRKKSATTTTTTTTIMTTTATANNSSSESDDEFSFIPNNNNFADITQGLIALEVSEDDADMDYEPGGDD
ncbi:unnamed protein product [Rotaria socialis]